jgi:hypothetical protein
VSLVSYIEVEGAETALYMRERIEDGLQVREGACVLLALLGRKTYNSIDNRINCIKGPFSNLPVLYVVPSVLLILSLLAQR